MAALMLTAASCTDYKPQKSTKEEKKVVMTMTIGKEEYEIKYELYRALFLNHKSEVDGGDSSVWSGENSHEYIDRINSIIISDAAKIFAAIYIADVGDTDFDVYSGKGDKLVEEYIEQSVEGTGGNVGFDSYEAYLAYLKSINLNYSTQDLMFRYYIALDKISEFYAGTPDNASREEDDVVYPNIDPSVDSVRDFYYSDACKRVFYAYFPSNTDQDPQNVYRNALSALNNGSGIEEIKRILGGNSLTTGQEVEIGLFLPRSAFNNDLHDELSPAAFALSDGSLSEVIDINGTGDSSIDGKYILYSMEKNEADFEKFYAQIRNAYVENRMGEMLNSHAAVLASSAAFTKDYSSVVHNAIAM